ncbi:hypothetical protein [Streptomyces adustus]|nr:hypothetical protein [Streptomyces adustus]
MTRTPSATWDFIVRVGWRRAAGPGSGTGGRVWRPESASREL